MKSIKVLESEIALTLAGMCVSGSESEDRTDDAASTSVLYRAISEQLSGDLGGEAVVLSLKTGKYYGLNLLGARIWELLREPISLSSIEATIMAEFEVEPDECSDEVNSFIHLLESEGLIERLDGSVSDISSTT